MKQKVFKTFVLFALLMSLVLSLFSQQQTNLIYIPETEQADPLPDFKIGISVGHVIDNENQFTNWDFNFIGHYNHLFISLGLLSDERVNGWGRRFGIGAKVTDNVSVLGTWSKVDRGLIVSHDSYGIDVGYKVWNGVHVTLGVETKRGIRIGFRYLDW